MATTKAPAEETEETRTSAVPAARPISRAVIWLGLAAGTAITVLAVMHGIRIPGLEIVLSVLATWALLMVLAVTAAELARRHHRAAAAHAWRHGRRGAAFTWRHGTRGAAFTRHHTRRGASWAWTWLATRARDRWQRRQPQPDIPADPPARPPRRLDGQPETEADARFFAQREAGYTGPIDQDGYAVDPTETEGTPTMPDTTVTDDSDPAARPAGTRTRLRTGGGAISMAWKQVVADTSDFEPEDDGHLLAWMAAEVNGMSNYAEAMTEVYETCVNSLGLDPVAMQATHDVADAAADAASAMAAARAKFASHYSEVREFAAGGGLLPFDGRWITGDGD